MSGSVSHGVAGFKRCQRSARNNAVTRALRPRKPARSALKQMFGKAIVMDIQGLQAALRDFAAQRNWQPFHSPKNLATALMVEAAELAEIFQWMTPDESRQAHGDPALGQRIAEELADVLLYLLQVADHTATDLQRAVQGKLLHNAQKYPPGWKADLDRPVAAADAAAGATHVLLDYENVQPTETQLRALVPAATHVWVFHGPHQKQIDQRFGAYGDALTAVPISRTGKNALDFHLSFYMGYITSRNQAARIVVVSNDTGYRPVLEHAEAMGFAVSQVAHPRKSTTAPQKPAARKTAAKKATAKKPATKKAPAAQAAAAAKKALPRKAPAGKVAAKKVTAPAAKKATNAAAPAKARAADKPGARATAAGAATPLPMQKIVDGLRKMGAKRPVKVASLKRALGPFLGTAASDAAVAAVLASLVASGDVVIAADGAARYPRFG